MTYKINKFFKVIVLSVDVFSSTVIDEKHFNNETDATTFQNSLKDSGYISVIVEM